MRFIDYGILKQKSIGWPSALVTDSQVAKLHQQPSTKLTVLNANAGSAN